MDDPPPAPCTGTRSMTERDKRIQKWAIIAFAIVEAVIIAVVLFVRG